MKLFLMTDDPSVLLHWQRGLHPFNPSTHQNFENIPLKPEAVVFVTTPVEGKIFKSYPTLRFMVLSMLPDFEESQFYLREGAMGYGNAMMHQSHLLSAFKTLEEGKVWLYPDFVTQLILQVQDHTIKQEKSLHLLDVLSVREKEVALLLGEGKSHFEIAEILGITTRTIKAHSASIYEKLHVKDRLALSILLHS